MTGSVRMRRAFRSMFGAALVVGLAACGGSGGSADGAPVTPPGGGSAAAAPGVTVLAGVLRGPGFADGTLAEAQFNLPAGVAFDPASGVIYIADTSNQVVRRISPEGVVSTLAGTPGRFATADGTGASAAFYFPMAVAVGPGGHVAVAEIASHTIRRITPAGTVTTIAGRAGSGGNTDGPAASATFNGPASLAYDAAGNLYIGQTGSVRKLDTDGNVSTVVVGSGQALGVAIDAAGNLVVAGLATPSPISGPRLRKFDAQGRALAWGPAGTDGIPFSNAGGVAISPAGDVIVSDLVRHTLLRVDAAGTVSLFAGQDARAGHRDGPAASARFQVPRGLASASGGRLLVVDQVNAALLQVDATGTVSTITGGVGAGQVDGSGAAARFFGPTDLTRAADGSLRVLDTGNWVIRTVNDTGEVGTFGSAADASRGGLAAAPNGTLYQLRSDATILKGFIEELDAPGLQVVRRVATGLSVARYAAADDGTLYFWSGARGDVLFRVRPGGAPEPWVTSLPCINVLGMVVDAAGLLNFSCITGGIYRVDAAGTVQLRAGVVNPSTAIVRDTSAVNGVLEPAIFRNPGPLAADGQGNLYVADIVSVRRIAPNGEVRTLAGSGVPGARFGTENTDLGIVQGIVWSNGAVFVSVRNAVLRIVPAD